MTLFQSYVHVSFYYWCSYWSYSIPQSRMYVGWRRGKLLDLHVQVHSLKYMSLLSHPWMKRILTCNFWGRYIFLLYILTPNKQSWYRLEDIWCTHHLRIKLFLPVSHCDLRTEIVLNFVKYYLNAHKVPSPIN